jgi:hypothetical protein
VFDMVDWKTLTRIGPLAGIFVLTTGCGGNGAHVAEATTAQAAIRTALDAWKAGQSPGSLESGTPPIHVKDLDWEGGFRLVSYKATDEAKKVGFDLNYPVELELQNPKGSPVKKTAVYTVTTHPKVLVVRQEG